MQGLRVAAAEREGFQSRQMDDSINPYELREADCSGRALATLVIAWVGAALVASVLLKWTQMWVALAVLTLLFLAACTYAAYDARKTHERVLAREEERQLERARRRQEQLDSVSGGIDNYPEIIDPPEYQTYWVSDLPPSYNTVIGTQPTNVSTAVSSPGGVGGGTDNENEETTASTRRLSNPPPYAIAIQTEPLFLPIQNSNSNNSNNSNNNNNNNNAGETSPSCSPVSQQNVAVLQSGENIGQTSLHGVLNNSGQQNNVLTTTQQRLLDPAPNLRDEDKINGDEQDNDINNGTVSLTRTQYLASIFNSTFGRNTRRGNNNNNVEQNSTNNGQIENHNNRNRAEQSIAQNNSTNNDRNFNNNGVGGTAIQSSQLQYPDPRLSDITFSNC